MIDRINSLNTDTNIDLSCFYNRELDSNVIPIVVENDLKYKRYNYIYNMSGNKTDPNVENLNKMASVGVNLFGAFLDSATPIVKDFSNKVKEFESKLNEPNHNNSLNTKRHEDKNNIYFAIELPRVKKEDCNIKYDKNSNSLVVTAKTETLDSNFSFLENKEYEIKLEVPKNLDFTGSNINAKNTNGMLYITISKCLIDTNNININILD